MLRIFNIAVIVVGMGIAFSVRSLYGRDVLLAVYPYVVGAVIVLLSLPLMPLILRQLTTSRSTLGSRKDWHKAAVTAVWLILFGALIALRAARPYLDVGSIEQIAAVVLLFLLGVWLTLLCNRIFLGKWRPHRKRNAPAIKASTPPQDEALDETPSSSAASMPWWLNDGLAGSFEGMSKEERRAYYRAWGTTIPTFLVFMFLCNRVFGHFGIDEYIGAFLAFVIAVPVALYLVAKTTRLLWPDLFLIAELKALKRQRGDSSFR